MRSDIVKNNKTESVLQTYLFQILHHQFFTMKTNKQKGYLALAIVSIVWGTTYIAAKVGATHMPGLFVSGVRQFISGVLMTGFFVVRGDAFPAWEEMKKISVQGILMLCIANGLITWSMEYISGGLAAIIVALVPFFTVFFSIQMQKKSKFTGVMLFGLLLGFAGILSIFYDYAGILPGKNFKLGIALALASTIVWAYGTVYTSGNKGKTHLLFAAGLQMLVAGIVMLIICYSTGKYVNLVNTGSDSWYALLYLIVFGSLISYSAYVFAIRHLSAAKVSVYAYINPIVAIICGWLLLNEKMTVNVIAGSLVTLLAIYIVNREFKKQQI